MPTYAFKCTNCDHRWEDAHKMSEPHPDTCPECTKEAVQQVIGAPLVVFEGGGWSFTGMSRRPHEKMEIRNGKKRKYPNREVAGD